MTDRSDTGGGPGRRRPGKVVGAALFLFVVVPGVIALSVLAANVEPGWFAPALVLGLILSFVLLRQLGREVLLGSLIAFGVAAVVLGGACVALLISFARMYR